MQQRLRSVWVSVGLLTAVVVQPLLAAPPNGHDLNLHYYRIAMLNALWEQGVFFSRWIPDLVFGYGSPLFNFYPPLSAYLLTGAYWLAGQNAPAAYNLTYALALAAGAAGMYRLAARLYGRWGGLLSAAAYTLSPFLLYQTYARGSISNAWALALFPWALAALLRLARRPGGKQIAVAAVALAAVMLAHTAAGLLFLASLLPVGATAVWLQKHRRRRAGVYAAAGVGLGLALAAFAWLPGLGEFPATLYRAEAGKVAFADHFADVLRWPARGVAEMSNSQWPKTPGIGQIGLALAGGVTAVAGVWRRRRQKGSWSEVDLLTVLFLLIGGAGLFLAISPSRWLWAHVGLLNNFQFPWRFLDLPTFFGALALGRVAMGMGKRRAWGASLLVGGAILFFWANAVPYFYPPRRAGLPARPTLQDVTAVQQAYGVYGLTAWGEYSAATVTTWPQETPFAGADKEAPLASKLLPTPVHVTTLESDPWRAVWRFEAEEETAVTLAHHHFPGWQLRIDGRAAPLDADGEGRMRFTAPAGTHRVELFWGHTPLRRLADGLSVAALLAVAGLLLWGGAGKATAPAAPPQTGRGKWLPALLLTALLLVKVGWLDRADSPWLVHPRPDGSIPGVARPEAGDFAGKIRLVGYDLPAPDRLTLYWRAQQRLDAIYPVRVTLADGRGAPVKEIVNRTPGDNVTSAWQAGQLTRDVYELPLAQGIRPIGYQIWVTVLQPAGDAPLPLQDGPPGAAEVMVGRTKVGPAETAVPPAARPVDVLFGEAIALSHALWPAQIEAGGAFDLTLYWRPRAAVDKDYTVFIHFLDESGALQGGNDGQPFAGVYPTSYWSPGELLADVHPGGETLPPGRYQIEVGLYELATGARLPLSGAATDSVILGWLDVTSPQD